MEKSLKEKYENLIVSTLYNDPDIEKLFKSNLNFYNSMKKVKCLNEYEPKFNFNYSLTTLEVLYTLDNIFDENIIKEMVKELVYKIIYNSYYLDSKLVDKKDKLLFCLPEDKIILTLEMYDKNYISFHAISISGKTYKVSIDANSINITIEEQNMSYDPKIKAYMYLLKSKLVDIKRVIDSVLLKRDETGITKPSYKNSIKFNEDDMETLDVLISLFEYDFDVCHYPTDLFEAFINILIDKDLLKITDKNRGTKLTLRYKNEFIIDIYETMTASKSDFCELVSYKKLCAITMEDIFIKDKELKSKEM